jgi:hypothetical protein
MGMEKLSVVCLIGTDAQRLQKCFFSLAVISLFRVIRKDSSRHLGDGRETTLQPDKFN